MTEAWYHVVVLGTDLAGLMLAALAARRGYRVCVVGHGGRPSAYKREGHWLLREPERFLGFVTSPAVQRVFGELSLGHEMKNRPQAAEPTLQVVMPAPHKVRLDLSAERRSWERDLERELPGALPVFDAFDRRLAALTAASDPAFRADAGGKGAQRHLRAAVENELREADRDLVRDYFGVDPRWRAVALAPLMHLAGVHTEPLHPFVTARLWTHLRAGLFRLPGGLDGLKAMFIRKLRDQSGDYRADAFAEGLVFRRGKAIAVNLAERGEAIGCEVVVGNTQPWHLANLIGAPSGHDPHALPEPVAWRIVVNIAVDPKLLPRGMATDVVLVGEGRPIWIARPGVGPHAGGDGRPGPGVLQAVAIIDARGAAPTRDAIERAVLRTVDAVRGLLPWFDQHLKVIDCPALLPPAASGADAADHGAHGIDRSAIGWIYGGAGKTVRATLGATVLDIETSHRNVLWTSDQAYAGLGFEGSCWAALQALDLVADMLPLRKKPSIL